MTAPKIKLMESRCAKTLVPRRHIVDVRTPSTRQNNFRYSFWRGGQEPTCRHSVAAFPCPQHRVYSNCVDLATIGTKGNKKLPSPIRACVDGLRSSDIKAPHAPLQSCATLLGALNRKKMYVLTKRIGVRTQRHIQIQLGVPLWWRHISPVFSSASCAIVTGVPGASEDVIGIASW